MSRTRHDWFRRPVSTAWLAVCVAMGGTPAFLIGLSVADQLSS